MLRVPSSINATDFESLTIQDTTFVAYRSSIYPARNEIFFEENAVVYVLEGEKKFVSPTQELYVKKRTNPVFSKRLLFHARILR